MQTLYASTRKGAARKDEQINDDTSVEMYVTGGGEVKQPDQTQDLTVNNSGMMRASKSSNKFIKKVNFSNLQSEQIKLTANLTWCPLTVPEGNVTMAGRFTRH